jgi:hypothetical protein
MEESRGISTNRIHVLEESEQKYQRLLAENARLQVLERTSNLKIAALEEQLAREPRLVQTQMSAQRLAFESQLHEITARRQKILEDHEKDHNGPSKYSTDSAASRSRPWPLVNAVSV